MTDTVKSLDLSTNQFEDLVSNIIGKVRAEEREAIIAESKEKQEEIKNKGFDSDVVKAIAQNKEQAIDEAGSLRQYGKQL